MDNIYIVIPAYEPDEKLTAVVEELYNETDCKLIVVNDGSGEDKRAVFESIKGRAVLLEHEHNRGKGAALKTAFAYIKENVSGSYGVITADADGQHKTADIMRIADALEAHPDRLIMGCRKFTGDIPFRSRFGNNMTRAVFRFAAGVGVSDTQTGLRGFSGSLTNFMLGLSGERYEFEMNMLLEAAREGIAFFEVPIETVYINDNKSSHFKPVRDSLRIYRDIIKFSCSSLLSFLVDYSWYSAVLFFSGNVRFANISARSVSSVLNFILNKKVVFKNKDNIFFSAAKYFLLAFVILTVNTELLELMVKKLKINGYIAKIAIEMLMFMFSWTMQRCFVFKKKGLTKDEK
ncbi:MAG: bifunctional glycosyltransferase family 2/GtrA family protein [Ruminococcus sp.]|uniref:bifunctional glycosyltransferase family 2/GtrA family protein n=1 Tax=Ruminococcus sp. TaxID=41978 RepID=UPI0025F4943C|nr:bifunctional glycosyltransferase family 2/GtrA family protein [Ruminococcus sp.]MBR0530414.1 bifunctional glycosyltransferase family 2/GtrA family protein [Ruminococcus sp.]